MSAIIEDRPAVGIIDYGVGNIRSVMRAVEYVGGFPVRSANYDTLISCDRLILPGVGAFAHGMQQLEHRGLARLVVDASNSGIPVLAICLGMQMLAEGSTEFGNTKGLGIVSGIVNSLGKSLNDQNIRLPHVDYRPLKTFDSTYDWLFEGISPDEKYYFIHSYALGALEKDVVSVSDYDGIPFAAVVAKGNVIGTQFHPEKSGHPGLSLLSNFISRCQSR